MTTTAAVTGTATGIVTGETETVIATATVTAMSGVAGAAADGDGWRLRRKERKMACQACVLLPLCVLPQPLCVLPQRCHPCLLLCACWYGPRRRM